MKNFSLKKLISVAVFGIGFSQASHGFLIDSTTGVGDTFTVEYFLAAGETDPNGNGNLVQDITGNVEFTLNAFDTVNNLIELALSVTNTSEDLGNNVGWQKLAFGVEPDALSVLFTDDDDGFFDYAQIPADPEVNNAVGEVLDIQTGTGNGYPRTLNEGQTDDFTLLISFADLTADGAAFDPFSSKWQTGGGSFEFPGNPDPDPDPDPDPMPVPGTVLLLGLGLLGLRFARGKARR